VLYFHEWLQGAGFIGASFWEHIQGWWDARHLPNLLLVHFNHLKADLPGEMRRIATFLGIEIDEARWPGMVEHCSLDYMRNAAATSPDQVLNDIFTDGANTFFNKGTNGRWKDVLTAADLAAYEKAVKANLTPECARWMATGEITS
jgi:aryl sulfotransferase